MFFWSLSLAQNSTVKDINQVLEGETSTLKKVKILNKWAKSLLLKHPDQALIYASKALKLAQENNYSWEKAASCEHLGFVYSRKHKFDKAISYYRQALDIFQAKQRLKKVGECLYQISRAYYYQEKYKQAKKYCLKGIEVGEKSNDSLTIGRLVNISGLIYGAEGKSDKAIAEYKKALDWKKGGKDTIGIGHVYNNIGIEYYNQGRYGKAVKLYEKALKFYSTSKDKSYVINLLTNLGALSLRQGQNKQAIKRFQEVLDYYRANDIKKRAYPLMNIGAAYLEEKEYTKSLQYFKKALAIETKANNKNGIIDILHNIGVVYGKQEKYEQALIKYKKVLSMCGNSKQKDRALALIEVGDILRIKACYKAAFDTLQVALRITKKLRMRDAQAQSYSALAKLDSTQGNFKRGWEFYKKLIRVNDSLFSEEKNKQLLEVQTRYEAQKKEQAIKIKNKQISLLKKEKEHERLLKRRFIESLVSTCVVGILIIILLYSKIKSKKRLIEYNKQLHKIENKNLQRELNLKQQQLTSKALHIVQKNGMLEKIRKNLQQMNENKESPNQELIKLLRMVSSSLKADREWDNFFSFFSEVHQDFFQQLKIKSEKLSNSELRLCALIKLKFTSKEISSILGITYGSISVARHRVRKKLALSKERKLSDFLADL
ncbi:tetratricopeptide repeat domain protein [Microscilla marina ATCC 23134]|uniref:Tetratricopeptide repeat domain protein n=2 Tax=Microscilla marina TaxID=1027 RepID=A1ZE67_MICM2|nr:tetratricopeptide repeat domain protein [Microscilla marina ATCC 23134]